MKCNNSAIIKSVPTLYFLILAGFVATTISIFQSENLNHGNPWWSYAGVGSSFILLFINIYKNAEYFEYDSIGEVPIFVNPGTFLSKYVKDRCKGIEFPKSKLGTFNVRDYFLYKSLNIYIAAQQQRTRNIGLNITFFNNKKLQSCFGIPFQNNK